MSLGYWLLGIPKTEEEYLKELAKKGVAAVRLTLDSSVDIIHWPLARAYYDLVVESQAVGMRNFRVSAHTYSQRHSCNFNSSLEAAWAHNVLRLDDETSESTARFVRRLSEQGIPVRVDASLLDGGLASELNVVRV